MGSISDHSNSPDTFEEDWKFAMQLSIASVLPMAIKALIELDVFEIISKCGQGAPLSASEIASHLPTSNQHDAAATLDRVLRLLASFSVLTCTSRTRADGCVERVYGLASVCKFLVKNQEGASLATMTLLVQDRVFLDMWHHVKDAVLEGGLPFIRAHGKSSYEYISTVLKFSELFYKAMWDHSTIVLPRILETYKGFEGIKELVDVGGGTGASLNMIISKYPHIKGLNFDLPEVVATAPNYPGVEHVGGDMFASVPSAEAILFKWIFSHWTDEQCLQILKNCYKALPDSGKVIIVENVLPEEIKNDVGAQDTLQFDVIEIAWSEGKMRTVKELEELAKIAGFAGLSLVSFACNLGVMECYKTV
ncbi:caffeic acid 3-O-methyltransferase-like isoform X2 [Magnolia sinica]|uniref:caffeic acid 3-O-methyltransferase-like isoform X2 n=1 Tax=Magnolia sinica TaxID=86752 RepID=UPI002659B5E7|nr:caffeic acid 3-O-methyltransferase-like isoform X2 [Magnolia sinica]